MLNNIAPSKTEVEQIQERASYSVQVQTLCILVVTRDYIALLWVHFVSYRKMIHLNPRRF